MDRRVESNFVAASPDPLVNWAYEAAPAALDLRICRLRR